MSDTMPNLVLFTTHNADEADLFLAIFARGTSDLGQNPAVRTYLVKQGIIFLERIDCAPTTQHKVGVAGNMLLCDAEYAPYAQTLLHQAGIQFTSHPRNFTTPAAAKAFFAQLRQQTQAGREAAIQRIFAGVRQLATA